jgi:serine/threonine-protein kinase RsbW
MKPGQGMTSISLHREVHSHLAEVDPVCRETCSLLEDNGLEAACFPVELVAREWLNNAIIHGNRRDAGKKVALNLQIGRKWIYLQIIDEGPGFNWRKARGAPLPDDTVIGGRGLPISFLYAHRITFNQRGNRVTLWLKKESKGG